MTYRELQTALRQYRAKGLTDIKLSGKGITKAVLQAEYDAVQAEIAAETHEPVAHSFAEMIAPRTRPAAKGFLTRTAANRIVTSSTPVPNVIYLYARKALANAA